MTLLWPARSATAWPSCPTGSSPSSATGPRRTATRIGSSPISWPAARSARRIPMPPRSREVKVGLVILGAVVVLAIGIFLIGEKNNLFSRKNKYYILFSSANGVKQGSPVQLDGVDVGTVKKVVLPPDPRLSQIQVWIDVDREYVERIRGGPQLPAGSGGAKAPSQARIKTLGLLGDKYIDLSSGAPEYPVIPSGGQIPAAQPTNVDALLASG